MCSLAESWEQYESYVQEDTGHGGNFLEFNCLYTKQKTQKHKTWHDGKLRIYGNKRVQIFENSDKGNVVLEVHRMSPAEWDREYDDEIIPLQRHLISSLEIIKTKQCDVKASLPPSKVGNHKQNTSLNASSKTSSSKRLGVAKPFKPVSKQAVEPNFDSEKKKCKFEAAQNYDEKKYSFNQLYEIQKVQCTRLGLQLGLEFPYTGSTAP